jgi:hypothetical protein
MSPRRAGVTIAAVLVVAGGVLFGLYISLFLQAEPTPVRVAAPTVREADLTLQTVAQVGHGPTPDWVSYYAKDQRGRWVHSTILKVPAHALIHVTVYQYDSATGLRNPLWGQPRGIVGGVMTVNGKPLRVLNPALASHTFAVPELGVSVPLKGVADDAPDQCASAPCGLDEAHVTIHFSFRTGKRGEYRWQCFVPCAAGTILGFGGPMQTIGYMDGELDVV